MPFNLQEAVDAAIAQAVADALAADQATDDETIAAIRAECARQIQEALAADAEADQAHLDELNAQIAQQGETISDQGDVIAAQTQQLADLQAALDACLAGGGGDGGGNPPDDGGGEEPPPEPTGWPDATNTGYKAHPEYPGSLTRWTGGRVASGQTYRFIDFDDGCTISVPNVTFIGCRFASNWVEGWNVRTDQSANNTAFSYCTIEPSGPPVIPHTAWPSAGLGVDIDGTTGGGFEPYMIAHGDAYQYGILNAAGAISCDHCDIWGYGNAISVFGSWQKTFTACWIHDAGAEGSGSGQFHTDGIGYLNGPGSCSNVLIEGCTIASLGNTNAIAFQAGTYTNIKVRGNYLSGFGYCVNMCHNNNANTGLEFTDNVIATDIGWHWGPIYTDFSSSFSRNGNLWRRNKLKVYPGSKPRPSAVGKFTAADDGKFVLPNGAYSATDWAA